MNTTQPSIIFIALQGALDTDLAAFYLGCSRTTLWRRVNLPESDPRKIKRTTYGTYPVAELDRHIEAELRRS